MKYGTALGIGLGICLLAAPAFAGDVTLTMQNGRVTLVAKDATLRQILGEWARVGQTRIVNIDRIPGGPMTLELTNVPEEQALNILLRSLSGYVAAPRAVEAPDVSRYDRILVMPTVAPARAATTTTAASTPTVAFQSSPAQPVQQDDDPDNNPAAQRGPVFTPFPQPQIVNPGAAGPGNVQQPYVVPPGMQVPSNPIVPATTPTGTPTSPAGVAVPGMMVPVPQQPATRRPGGA